jgi:hypothetical protein
MALTAQSLKRGDWIKYRDARGIEHITEIRGFCTKRGEPAVDTPVGVITIVRLIEHRPLSCRTNSDVRDTEGSPRSVVIDSVRQEDEGSGG